MIKNKKVIGIIPARAGSKGLKDKNISMLLGKPLVAWSIEAGRGSKYIDTLMVTTDSLKINEISKKYGAETPFLRPKELATDSASSIDVVEHALNYYKNNLNQEYDYVVLLEPTSPQRTSIDIDKAIEKLEACKKSTALVTVSKVETCHPAFMIKIDNEGFFVGYEKNTISATRRQDFEDLYFIDGSIYMSQYKELIRRKTFYHDKTVTYTFPKWKSLEIDDIDDFIMVEAMMNSHMEKKDE